MEVSGNSTSTVPTTASGGGIFLGANSTLRLNNSTISGNTTATSGGGVYFFNGGSLLIEQQHRSPGTASNTRRGPVRRRRAVLLQRRGIVRPPGPGPAPPRVQPPGTLVIRNSTIANNTPPGLERGVRRRHPDSAGAGPFQVENSTMTGNTANDDPARVRGRRDRQVIELDPASGIAVVSSSVSRGTPAPDAPDILSRGRVNVNVRRWSSSNAGNNLSGGPSGNNLAYGTNAAARPP